MTCFKDTTTHPRIIFLEILVDILASILLCHIVCWLTINAPVFLVHQEVSNTHRSAINYPHVSDNHVDTFSNSSKWDCDTSTPVHEICNRSNWCGGNQYDSMSFQHLLFYWTLSLCVAYVAITQSSCLCYCCPYPPYCHNVKPSDNWRSPLEQCYTIKPLFRQPFDEGHLSSRDTHLSTYVRCIVYATMVHCMSIQVLLS